MPTRPAPEVAPITADVPTAVALAEIHRRLGSIHYTLAAGEGDIVPRALDKLDALLREIDGALAATER